MVDELDGSCYSQQTLRQTARCSKLCKQVRGFEDSLMLGIFGHTEKSWQTLICQRAAMAALGVTPESVAANPGKRFYNRLDTGIQGARGGAQS